MSQNPRPTLNHKKKKIGNKTKKHTHFWSCFPCNKLILAQSSNHEEGKGGSGGKGNEKVTMEAQSLHEGYCGTLKLHSRTISHHQTMKLQDKVKNTMLSWSC